MSKVYQIEAYKIDAETLSNIIDMGDNRCILCYFHKGCSACTHVECDHPDGECDLQDDEYYALDEVKHE